MKKKFRKQIAVDIAVHITTPYGGHPCGIRV